MLTSASGTAIPLQHTLQNTAWWSVPPGALEVPIKDTGTSPHTLLDHTKTQLETHPNIALHHQTSLKTHAARAICVEGLRDPYREALLD